MNNPVNLDSVLHELSQRMGVPISVNQGASIITTQGGDEFWLEAPEESALIVVHTSIFDNLASSASSIMQLQNYIQLNSKTSVFKGAWLGIHDDTSTLRLCVTIPKSFVDASTLENIFENVIRLSDDLKKNNINVTNANNSSSGAPFVGSGVSLDVVLEELGKNLGQPVSTEQDKSTVKMKSGSEFIIEAPVDSSILVINTTIKDSVNIDTCAVPQMQSLMQLNTKIDVMKGSWVGIDAETKSLRLYVAVPRNFIGAEILENVFSNVVALGEDLMREHIQLTSGASTSASPATASASVSNDRSNFLRRISS